jgi:Acetyltransferase (GNAT) family.
MTEVTARVNKLSEVKVREISTKKDKLRFIEFINKLYKDNKYFCPTLTEDELEEFDPAKNGAFVYAECRMFLAERDGKVVGRIAGVLNRKYNEKMNVKQMRFTRFDFIDDYAVSAALYDTVRKWALECGMTEMLGPIGFSDLDKQGLLYEGFDVIDMYVTPYNAPYYVNHYERLGLVKKVDWVEYEIIIPDELDPRVNAIADRAREKYGYTTKHFKKINLIKPWIKPGLDIMNAAFAPLFGVVQLEDKQLEDYGKTLMMVGNPDFIQFVFNKENKPIGYGFMAPNLTRGMRACHGHIFPWGVFTIPWDLRHSKILDMYSIAVLPEYQSLGVNAIIMQEGLKGAKKHGMKKCYTGPELEDNFKIQGQWKLLERKIVRRRRCYIAPANLAE